MKRPSLINKILFSSILITFSVMIVLGASILFIMIDDVNQSEKLLDYSKKSYKDSIDLMFSDYDNILGSILRNTYSNLDHVLSNYISLYHDMQLKDLVISYLNTDFVDGYFLVDHNGNITYDTTGYFSGNLFTMKDDRGESVAELYKTTLTSEDQVKFEAMFDGQMYYSLIRALDDDLLIGLTMSNTKAEELFTHQLQETASLLPDTVVTDLEIIELEDIDELLYFKYPLNAVYEMSRAKTDDVLEYHTENNLLFYKILNNKWLIILESQLISELENRFQENMAVQSKQLVLVSHVLVFMVVAMSILVVLFVKDVKNKTTERLKYLESYSKNTTLDLDLLKYDEFYRIYQLILTNQHVEEVKDNHNESEVNTSYIMGLIKHHYIDLNMKLSCETFNFSEMLNQLISDLLIESAFFQVNVIDDTESNIFQNRELTKGVLIYIIVNLLVYGHSSRRNIIKIEAIEYHEEIIVTVSRNKIDMNKAQIHELIHELDSIDEYVQSGLNGLLDYSEYEKANKSINLHLPKEKLT